MYGLLKGTKTYLRRPKKIDKPRPDNFVFRLHYQFTFGILAICCLLVTSYGYIDSKGSAIQCMLDKGIGVDEGLINKYCWIMSTFTLPRHWEDQAAINGHYIHPGVGPDAEDEDKQYHAYYQWVPLFLGFQAVMFYAPHWIWKQLEGGRLKNIIAGLNNSSLGDTGEEKKGEIDALSAYMKERLKDKWDHNIWTAKLYVCEILNFLNVILQLHLTDVFLDGSFSKYGLNVLSWSDYDPENRIDPMSRVFPQMTKCHFHKFGPSGTIQKFDALCVLGMNIINEKIYVFLWFWFIFLAVATALNLVVKLVTFFVPSVRSRMVVIEEQGFRHIDEGSRKQTEQVISRLTYPDWLILYYLAQCMHKRNFTRLIKKMCDLQTEMEEEEEELTKDTIDDSTLKSKATLRSFLPSKKTSAV